MEIQSLERRNSEYALFESQRKLDSQKQQLLMANHWADEAQRERIQLCSELGTKSHLHKECYARVCQEIEELKRRCNHEENAAKERKLEEFVAQQDQESRTVNLLRDQVRRLQDRLEFIEDSRIFQDPDSPSSSGSADVTHQAHVSSSSIKPSRETRTPRITRADMSIPGDVIDCQPARRDPHELHDISKNLATSSGIPRKEGIEKSGSEEPLQSMPSPCFQVRARKKVWTTEIVLCLWQTMLRVVGLVLKVAWEFRVILPRMHLGKFPGHPEFQSWILNFRTEVCSKAKKPMLALQWSRKS